MRLAEAAPAVTPTGPLPGAYGRAALPVLERKLSTGNYSLRDVEAAVVDIAAHELVNVNTEAELRKIG